MDSHNYLLKIAYDGSSFYGWQKTSSGPSIEAELEKALFTILRKKPTLQAASRTDRGVHAEGQIINFFSEKELNVNRILFSLNQLLPPTIRVLEMKKVPIHFHPSLDAKYKTYHYHLSNAPILLPHKRLTVWHYQYPLDFAILKPQFKSLIGEHDFSSFSNKKYVNPFCTIQNIRIEKIEDHYFIFIFTGDRFLYNMVRILAGTFADIASKKISASLKDILENKKRKLAGITAPAQGLILKSIVYQDSL